MTKKVLYYGLVFLAVLALTPSAFADLVMGTADWQSWGVSNPNENGIPYWDNMSWDGAGQNVGYYLTNRGGFLGSTAGPGAIPFWGGAYNPGSGLADPNFYLTRSGASRAALKIEIAGNKDINEFGWYDLTAPTTLNTIFGGSINAPATSTFTPSAHYGFYFSTADGTFRTESGQNSAYPGEQHFALFQGADGYWLGMEDLAFYHSDKDYNDMIVRVSSTPTPIPAAFWLLGSGLVGLLGLRRKFMK